MMAIFTTSSEISFCGRLLILLNVSSIPSFSGVAFSYVVSQGCSALAETE
jgi:hypothetical protein